MSHNQVPILATLDVEATDDIPFQFDLKDGEVITTFTVEVSVAEGSADPDAQLLAVGTAQIGRLERGEWLLDLAGPVVLQRFTGRQAGTLYGIRGVAILSSGRKLVAAALLPIKRLASTLDTCE